MQGKSILDFFFFKLFLDNRVIDVIVSQTNLFADQFLSGQVVRPFSRIRARKSTNSNEIKKFLAVRPYSSQSMNN